MVPSTLFTLLVSHSIGQYIATYGRREDEWQTDCTIHSGFPFPHQTKPGGERPYIFLSSIEANWRVASDHICTWRIHADCKIADAISFLLKSKEKQYSTIQTRYCGVPRKSPNHSIFAGQINIYQPAFAQRRRAERNYPA